jgi:hypothetical protein
MLFDTFFIFLASYTFFFHASFEAFAKPAIAALIPFIFVYHAMTIEPIG